MIVVPVPDTAKAAADSMAFQLKVPSLEGLIRNRYIGRTFIEGNNRADKVRMKYTPLPEVMEGKRILLVDDSIVRATTLKELLALLKDRGRAKENGRDRVTAESVEIAPGVKYCYKFVKPFYEKLFR